MHKVITPLFEAQAPLAMRCGILQVGRQEYSTCMLYFPMMQTGKTQSRAPIAVIDKKVLTGKVLLLNSAFERH